MRETTIFQRMTKGTTARIGVIGGLVAAEDGVVHYFADGRDVGACGSDRPTGARQEQPPIVLLHGASGNLRDFTLSLLPTLARRHRVIAFDRPGFGHSSHAPGCDRLEGQVRVLRRALRRLGHRRCHLVGHSYGGAVALDWALRHPQDVASLGLISAVSMDWGGALGMRYRIGRMPGLGFLTSQIAPVAPERFIAQTLEEIFAPAAVPRFYREAAGIGLALRPSSFRRNQRQINALHPQIVAMVDNYHRLRCPVAVIHGDRDGVVPARVHAEPAARRLPRARLTIIPGAGHMPHHSHPTEVARAIEDVASRSVTVSAAMR